ncbi:hypothetical protein [Streptosporangium sp. NPDC051022]|uniref:hypothetical protein n=1 Tax=Streptosporangium sp. NPDC051022 TaxID=3155752 RepID=UPI003415A397
MKRVSLAITAVLGLMFSLLCSPAHAATIAVPAVPPNVLRAAEDLKTAHPALSVSPTLTFNRPGPGGSTRKPSAAADEITCTAQAQYPHQSTGTPSAVDGKAASFCTAPIADIRAQAELYRYLDGYGFSLVGIGSLSYALNSAGPVTSYGLDLCQGRPAYYVLRGIHNYSAPPGYTPPTITLNTQTPPVLVDC